MDPLCDLALDALDHCNGVYSALHGFPPPMPNPALKRKPAKVVQHEPTTLKLVTRREFLRWGANTSETLQAAATAAFEAGVLDGLNHREVRTAIASLVKATNDLIRYTAGRWVRPDKLDPEGAIEGRWAKLGRRIVGAREGVLVLARVAELKRQTGARAEWMPASQALDRLGTMKIGSKKIEMTAGQLSKLYTAGKVASRPSRDPRHKVDVEWTSLAAWALESGRLADQQAEVQITIETDQQDEDQARIEAAREEKQRNFGPD